MEPMVLYLCQHGDALAKDVDPDRPLSERGTTDVCNVANALSGTVEIEAIVHSGKTRARQTAELLHERLAPGVVIKAETGLGPKDPVDEFARRLSSQASQLMVVGHMPFVGHLASHLLGSERDILAFEPGTVVSLTHDTGDGWMLTWMLNPRLVSS